MLSEIIWVPSSVCQVHNCLPKFPYMTRVDPSALPNVSYFALAKSSSRVYCIVLSLFFFFDLTTNPCIPLWGERRYKYQQQNYIPRLMHPHKSFAPINSSQHSSIYTHALQKIMLRFVYKKPNKSRDKFEITLRY